MGVIKYLLHDEIDKEKWDDCIRRSANSLIYAHSVYLDCTSDNWDALVLDDYLAVMPLPWKRKYGIQYIYQPFLVAQAGVFAINPKNINVGNFIEAIPKKFRLVEIPLNTQNTFQTVYPNTTLRSNYVLSLSGTYEDLYNKYKDNNKRNSRKAMQAGCTFSSDVDLEQLILLATGQMHEQGMETRENISRFRKLYAQLLANGEAICYCIRSPENEILSACCFFVSANRAYYILVGNSKAAKQYGASHALIDNFIREYSGRDMILDFEGSDIPGLAFFYSGFGAEHETYPAIRLNRLPWYLRVFKK